MMIVLIPVSRFRVRYEVAAGFPYSQLDSLVLRAVGEGSTSLEKLVETFQVHPRLLIQSLVTLTHTGDLDSDMRTGFAVYCDICRLKDETTLEAGRVLGHSTMYPFYHNHPKYWYRNSISVLGEINYIGPWGIYGPGDKKPIKSGWFEGLF